MGALKLFADGSLGSRTAYLSQPYTDDPGNRGLQAMSGADIDAAVRDGDRRGFQVLVHAIGDAAADMVLRSFEAVTSPGHNPRRHGLMHCEVMNEALLDRMAHNGVVAFVQPAFLAHDIYFVEDRLGRERARYFLPCASLVRRGIPTGYGTDCPVESLDPLRGIAWAVLRRPPNGTDAECFFPEERVDRYTAVDAYTQGSAQVTAGEGVRKGRIRPGYLADLVLLDRNIFTIPADEIPAAKVQLTMTGGRITFCGKTAL
jgi:predicted amidohydrolase YtcJ